MEDLASNAESVVREKAEDGQSWVEGKASEAKAAVEDTAAGITTKSWSENRQDEMQQLSTSSADAATQSIGNRQERWQDATVVKKPEQKAQTTADVAAVDGESRSHDDVIQKAEERRDVTNLVKAAVREESERMKEIPAWEKESDSEKQIDPRNRVGEEATKIMDDSHQLREVVQDQAVAVQKTAGLVVPKTKAETERIEPKMGVDQSSKQDIEHKQRLEGREMVEQLAVEDQKKGKQEPKTARYDSIDPLAERQGASCPASAAIPSNALCL